MDTADTMVPLVKTVPYLAGLRSDVLRTVAARRVKFYRTSAEGREQVMRVFDHQGDTFCIPSAFRAGTYIVSVRAVTEARLHLLDVDTLIRLAEEHPPVALNP